MEEKGDRKGIKSSQSDPQVEVTELPWTEVLGEWHRVHTCGQIMTDVPYLLSAEFKWSLSWKVLLAKQPTWLELWSTEFILLVGFLCVLPQGILSCLLPSDHSQQDDQARCQQLR